MWLYILLTIVLSQSYNVRSTNHYTLKDDGIIKRRLDSPFHLRQPDNLLMFVEQIRNNENAEQAFRKMQRKRSTLDDRSYCDYRPAVANYFGTFQMRANICKNDRSK